MACGEPRAPLPEHGHAAAFRLTGTVILLVTRAIAPEGGMAGLLPQTVFEPERSP